MHRALVGAEETIVIASAEKAGGARKFPARTAEIGRDEYVLVAGAWVKSLA